MKYHIALSTPSDLEAIARTASAGKCPSHAMWEISQLLGARVYQPESELVLPIDKMRAKIIGRPEHWALARQLSKQLQEDDVVYCTGEDIGIALGFALAERHRHLCGAKPKRPKIVVHINNVNRLRGRLALKLFNIADRIDLFVTFSPSQADFLRRYLRLPENRVYQFFLLPIDSSFFTPGPASHQKLRPYVGSGGMEKRDYRTLADATKDLDVDVKVCAFSHNAKASKRTFPNPMPSNMSCRFYEWCELVQLYRDSDLVVITMFENNYNAGLTTMFEAMACRRPVVMTRSPGMISDMIDSGIVTGVNPRDVVGLFEAIEKLLNDPQKAEEQAQRGYELVLNQYNQSNYVQALMTKLISTFESINN